jgi:hypothetical protein
MGENRILPPPPSPKSGINIGTVSTISRTCTSFEKIRCQKWSIAKHRSYAKHLIEFLVRLNLKLKSHIYSKRIFHLFFS